MHTAMGKFRGEYWNGRIWMEVYDEWSNKSWRGKRVPRVGVEIERTHSWYSLPTAWIVVTWHHQRGWFTEKTTLTRGLVYNLQYRRNYLVAVMQKWNVCAIRYGVCGKRLCSSTQCGTIQIWECGIGYDARDPMWEFLHNSLKSMREFPRSEVHTNMTLMCQ